MVINLVVSRAEVYDEVSKLTDYTGSKLSDGGSDVRDQMLMADADLASLGRFWDEAAAVADERLKELMDEGKARESDQEDYRVALKESERFDAGLAGSASIVLRSVFVALIAGKWFRFVDKSLSEEYFTQAAGLLDDLDRLLYRRKGPEVPRYGRQVF